MTVITYEDKRDKEREDAIFTVWIHSGIMNDNRYSATNKYASRKMVEELSEKYKIKRGEITILNLNEKIKRLKDQIKIFSKKEYIEGVGKIESDSYIKINERIIKDLEDNIKEIKLICSTREPEVDSNSVE